MALRTMHLFAGAGGGILADMLLGHTPVCAVEIEDYPRKVLLQRQIDGCLPMFPIWDDVRTFDGIPWRGKVDIIAGGFPCTDISAAGKGAGITGERSGLWSEMARIISEVRPAFVFVENSPKLVCRGIDRVLSDLSEMRYNAIWDTFTACTFGAPHTRERLFLLAYTDKKRQQTSRGKRDARGHKMAERWENEKHIHTSAISIGRKVWRKKTPESSIPGVADGIPNRVDRNKCAGNAQIPIVAATAWRILTNGIIEQPTEDKI